MNSYEWILYAGVAVWSGLGLYTAWLAIKQARLSKRIKQLAFMMEDDKR